METDPKGGDAMALKDQFQKAQQDVNNLAKRPSNQELLTLYALFKQASTGDVEGKRPGMLDMKGRAKYDAWAEKKGMKKNEAMKQYVEYVSKLQSVYGMK
jgi:acyl-CoA-binding protein